MGLLAVAEELSRSAALMSHIHLPEFLDPEIRHNTGNKFFTRLSAG